MKLINYLSFAALCGAFFLGCQSVPAAVDSEDTDSADVEEEAVNLSYLKPDLLDGTTRNPIITHVFTADPTARVFGDRVYLYASHDRDDATGYNMNDYHVFSSDDLVNWQDHGVVLDANDFWASQLYAPDCVYDSVNKRYLLFFPNSGSNIGVAVSDNPAGPFIDALGKPLITPSYPGARVPWCFDPGVLIDDDGQAYLYFGGGMPGTGDNAKVIRLGDDMLSLKDAAATTIPAPDYFEAPFTVKRNGKYYFTYSTNWENGHGIRIDYMMSDNPMTGWEYKGVVIDNPPQNHGNNNHHSLVEFQGQWYVFYHSRNLAIKLGKSDFQRSVNIDRISFAENGEIIPARFTDGDIKQLKYVSAFGRIEAELIAAQFGVEVEDIYAADTKTGASLADLQNGDWSAVSGVDFGEGVSVFNATVAANRNGGTIELWIDGGEENGGTLLGICKVPDTGSLDSWKDVSCDIQAVSGVHNLYLIYKGKQAEGTLFRFDSYMFQ